MNFTDFISSKETFDFYGVCNNEFKLDDVVFEAIEDPCDGYRSYLDSVEVIDSKSIFFSRPLAKVKVVEDSYRHDGYDLIDFDDNHVWVTFGTGGYDSYYPYFYFHYTPKNCN